MRIAVAMSGGVDSSAAAAILKEQGHELVGFTMQLWNQRRGLSVDENGEPLPSRCCSLDDVYDARVEFDAESSRYRLLRGRDPQKDQSYFLWELTQDQLSRALFPLGEMSKSDARQAARDNYLAVAEKKESQEICFVPDGDYAGFIDRYLESEGQTDRLPAAGEILTSTGEVVGAHNGIHRYTIGQRRGIGI